MMPIKNLDYLMFAAEELCAPPLSWDKKQSKRLSPTRYGLKQVRNVSFYPVMINRLKELTTAGDETRLTFALAFHVQMEIDNI